MNVENNISIKLIWGFLFFFGQIKFMLRRSVTQSPEVTIFITNLWKANITIQRRRRRSRRQKIPSKCQIKWTLCGTHQLTQMMWWMKLKKMAIDCIFFSQWIGFVPVNQCMDCVVYWEIGISNNLHLYIDMNLYRLYTDLLRGIICGKAATNLDS